MKKATRFLMAAFVLTAFLGFASCTDDTKDDPTPTPTPEPTPVTYEESTSYAIVCGEDTITAGSTVEGPMGFKVDMNLVNKTDATLATRFKIEKVSGPAAMNHIGVCIEMCTEQNCPYTSDQLNIPAKGSQFITIEHMEDTDMTATYKLTVGEGLELKNPQVIFVKLTV